MYCMRSELLYVEILIEFGASNALLMTNAFTPRLDNIYNMVQATASPFFAITGQLASDVLQTLDQQPTCLSHRRFHGTYLNKLI